MKGKKMKYSNGCEVTLIAYNGKSYKSSTKENVVTGLVEKTTAKYIWVRSYEDGKIWKAVI
jgi:hypothetical protein